MIKVVFIIISIDLKITRNVFSFFRPALTNLLAFPLIVFSESLTIKDQFLISILSRDP